MDTYVAASSQHRRARIRRLRLAVVLVAVVAVALWAGRAARTMGVESTSGAVDPTVPVPAGPGVAAPSETSPPAPGVEPATTPVAVAGPVVVEVPAARAGDLRVDASADTLALGYRAGVESSIELAYGVDPKQRLELFLPDRAHAPVVVFVHGGGWMIGDKARGGQNGVPERVLRFVEQGYAVASVNYRLAPAHPFPAPIHDVKHAIRFLKAYGAETGLVDGDRMVAYGVSAGGHLATLAAATPGTLEPADLPPELAGFDSSVAGVVSVVGITDVVEYGEPSPHAAVTGMRVRHLEAILGCSPCAEDVLQSVSPLGHLGAHLPPGYFAYGGEDVLVAAGSQGRSTAEAWAEHAGAGQAWFELMDGVGHNVEDHVVNQRAVELFVAWVSAG